MKMPFEFLFLIVSFIAALVTDQCRANLNGSDDFNGNSKDTNRWGTDFVAGAGSIKETNGYLQYTTTNIPTSFDIAGWPWVLNYGSYTQDWEIHIDVNVPHMGLSSTGTVTFGLLVFPGQNPSQVFSNRFIMQLNQTTGNTQNFVCDVATSSAGATHLGDHETASTSAAVRIVFDATTKVLSSFYDEDGPSCGYSWAFLGSTNVPPDWNMTNGSVFGVLALANSKYTSVTASNNVFGDNFYASSGAMPNLAISRAGGAVLISWPTNAPACFLESANTLMSPICWQVSTNAAGISGTHFITTNAISNGSRYYRLSK